MMTKAYIPEATRSQCNAVRMEDSVSFKGGFSDRVQTVCYRHARLQACITSHGVPRGHEEAGESEQTHPQGVSRSSLRKTPRHVPDMGVHLRQGLSHMVDVPPTPEE